jgi:hypothetical protein
VNRLARLLLRLGFGRHRAEAAAATAGGRQHTGSLSRRMLMIAFAWVTVLLVGGGLALDHTLTGLVTRNFDDQLGYMLTAMVASAEIGPDGGCSSTDPGRPALPRTQQRPLLADFGAGAR